MQGHQVLEVHTQHRQPEACAASPGAAVTGIVVVGSEELSQLQQGLCGRPCYRRGVGGVEALLRKQVMLP